MNVRFFVPRVKRLWLFENSKSQKRRGRGVQDETAKDCRGVTAYRFTPRQRNRRQGEAF
jgi:hypothetical protein